MATSQAVSEGAGSGARSKAKVAEKRGLSLADTATLALIAIVVVLVSLPRLRRFALRENETDAIAMLRILAVDAIANREALLAGGLSALLATSTGHRVRLEDIEVLDDGRLRRHGYVFESVCDAEGRPVLIAWPWDHGRTGVAAFAVEPGGPVFGLPNGDGRFSGLSSPPRDKTDPWRLIPGG